MFDVSAAGPVNEPRTNSHAHGASGRPRIAFTAVPLIRPLIMIEYDRLKFSAENDRTSTRFEPPVAVGVDFDPRTDGVADPIVPSFSIVDQDILHTGSRVVFKGGRAPGTLGRGGARPVADLSRGPLFGACASRARRRRRFASWFLRRRRRGRRCAPRSRRWGRSRRFV